VEGKELLDQALQAQRGLIIGLPHLGCWEILGVYLPTVCELTALYRPIPKPLLDRFVKRSRMRAGTKLAPIDNSGIRQLVQALKNNEAIIILPDQDPRLEGQVFAPFFGIQASTATLLPRLAHKTQASVLFCYCERLANATYKIHFRQAEADIANADLGIAASAMNRDIEACIRQIPEQYQWSYKRFKTRPNDQDALY
jgi:KDO2-lipid IV(A) lauroyltransferase